jgi:hypothetical protein
MNNLQDKFNDLENRLQNLERYSKVDVGQCYPIGSVYSAVSTLYNPTTTLGYGTWFYCGAVLAYDGATPCAVFFWERTA